MDEHQGIAPCIPVWKTGLCLSTPMLGTSESTTARTPAKQNFVVHVFLLSKSESPRQEPAVRQRENLWKENLAKPPFGLRLRAGPTVSNCWWDFSPSHYLESVISRLRNRTAIEPAHPQNRTGKLPMRLLADSKCFELVRKPGFAPGPSSSQGEMLLITPQS